MFYKSKYHICRNKRPGHLIFRSNKKISKTHHNQSVLCTPPFEKSPIKKPSVSCTPPFEKSPTKTHRFCVLPPVKNHPPKPIGFVYSSLWKTTHQKSWVSCTPPFEKITHQKAIGFVYSPLWKITHQNPSVLCTPPLKNHFSWWANRTGPTRA